MLHEMRLRPEEFDNIKYNNKIIEVRLNDKKRRKINVGDKIIFYKVPELNETINVKVKNIYKFSTFKDLYSGFPSTYFGYSNLNISDMLNKIYSIYSHKKEEEEGVLAIMFQIDDEKAFTK
ncbi:hypothetical protein CLHOM_32190 [Clostridium homopropionicum DSM 5847]|uniref:ASCH domain-containing protein n=1 Tax=Clostridium homopropionicum DSM 5847 TaxID=1121318 RepID=A0A0L6Z5T3_9CLOT|nr:ASCH domain-containing protein [Clostridium homopropionicum]KOA18322.1 hypothetical protein CLHOM_32190 [Clostridium homopropionicum DSM 5847]SFF69179.1 ASC-1 homology (ASCH) domain-containing protein [Clostridium homopropionicum]